MDWKKLGIAIVAAIVYFAVIFGLNFALHAFFATFGGMAILVVSLVLLFILVVIWTYNTWL